MTKNIALITTVSSFELYKKTSLLYPNVDLYIIDGRNGMHGIDSIFYMFKVLKNKNIDWLIMADEDVIFKNPNNIFKTIDYMSNNGYSVCGIRDGGSIEHRIYNPNVINTFFSIINFKKIQQIFSKKEILKNQYTLKNEFSDDLTKLKYIYDTESIYEPYYSFYLWLRRKEENFLFLDAVMLDEQTDKITNLVKGQNGKVLLYHTWYARSYGENEKHTRRIDLILNQFSGAQKEVRKSIIFKDHFFIFKKMARKNIALLRLKLDKALS